MTVRTFLRPFIPVALRSRYYQRLVRRTVPDPDALRCREFVASGDLVLDLGANIGVYTKLLSDWVGPEGSVYSYEPIPETFQYLRHNVEKFRLANVTLHNSAVSSRCGRMTMTVPNGNFYRASISSVGNREIRVVRLDDEFVEPRRVTFIKCDVEGHEQEVIDGAMRLVERDHPVWLMETKSIAVVQRMTELGYAGMRLGHDWLFRQSPAKS
jgi:FkbM family methyltransferase